MKKLLTFFCFFALCLMPCAFASAATVITDTETESVLYELITPLADAAKIPAGRLVVHILDDDEFNAFVMGGTDVYVNTGLITGVKTPAEFQAVVAHELGHMIGGHAVQMSAAMDAAMKQALLMQALGIALVALNPMAGIGVMAGASGVPESSLLAFSRNEERVADDYGVKLLTAAHINPNALYDVMKYMNDMQGTPDAKINPFLQSHPMTSERLRNIRDAIDKTKKQKTKNENYDVQYKMIVAKLVGYLWNNDAINAKYPASDTTAPALYARAIAQMRAGNLADAAAGTRKLIAGAANNPFFYELLGDIEYQFGHYDDSVDAYKKSLKLLSVHCPTHCDTSQIQTALGLVLVERGGDGDTDMAAENAKSAILVAPTPLAYMVLSRAESARGNMAASDLAMANFYKMTGDKKAMKNFAHRTIKESKKDSSEYIRAEDLLTTDN